MAQYRLDVTKDGNPHSIIELEIEDDDVLLVASVARYELNVETEIERRLDAQYDEQEDRWQEGYDRGYEDGREIGFDDGLEEARRRI